MPLFTTAPSYGALSSLSAAINPIFVSPILHPIAYTITPFTVLHALRLAHAYHSVIGMQGKKVGTGKGDVGMVQAALVCSGLVFAGTTVIAALKGEPAPLISEAGSGELVAAYGLAAVAMKWLLPWMDLLPQNALQSLWLVLDGFANSFGALTLGLHPLLATSSPNGPTTIASIIIPLISGSFGTLLVPVFSLFSPTLAFAHPSWLFETPKADIYGSLLVTAIYGGLVDGRGPIFGNVQQVFRFFGMSGGKTMTTTSGGALMQEKEAQLLCALILSSVFLYEKYGPQPSSLLPSNPHEAKKVLKALPVEAKRLQPNMVPLPVSPAGKKSEVEKLKSVDLAEARSGDSGSEFDVGESTVVGGRELRKRKGESLEIWDRLRNAAMAWIQSR